MTPIPPPMLNIIVSQFTIFLDVLWMEIEQMFQLTVTVRILALSAMLPLWKMAEWQTGPKFIQLQFNGVICSTYTHTTLNPKVETQVIHDNPLQRCCELIAGDHEPLAVCICSASVDATLVFHAPHS